MTESIFLWLVEKEPLKNRMILNGDYILSKMVEEDDHERFQSVEEIRIELDTGSELFDNSNITTVLQQLKNPDGTEWFRNATFFNPLGQGAFGFVTEARNEQTGQVTAVKVLICPDTETDIGAQKEYNNIKFTYHRNLVRTHQIRETVVELEELRNLKGALTSGSDAQFDSMMSRLYEEKEDQDVNDGLVKLVCLEMELCGQTLAEWLQSGKKRDDPSRTVLIIQDIFDGIGFLHGKNILHRDLKPANILFSPGESLPVKIADFGLSRKICDGMHQSCSSGQGIDETAVFSTSVGTPIYRAPEVATGTYGTPADLYSLGFILWEILCQISPKQKSLLFQRLKNKDSTVLDSDQANSIISNGAEIIISLTQEQVVERPLSITEIKLVTHPGIRFTPEDTFQLKTFLKCGGPGARVELGRVLCHKTSLNNRQDTMMVEWNLTNNRKTSTKSGYNLEAGCLIKGTEPDELNGFDIKLVGIKASESLVGKQYFRFLYINLQESCNCPDVTKGWIYPTSSLQYISNQDLAHDKFELSGVTDFRGKIETIKTDDGIGRDDRKVVIVVNFDACLLGLRGDDADFNGVGCINNLEDVIRKHSLSVAIQGEAYIILK
ncbi:probable serine/threonine-protein kinase fhkA [Folsomia candida]|nr:probable serine/threonine-protein kinase fhkA [Folsomia candida]